ncbi:MAG: sugar phosphate isomerase/epimerase family protein [Phycisphaeraceae bacterium]
MTWTRSAFADEAADSAADQIAALEKAKIDHVDLRSVDGINIVELPVDHAKQVKQLLDDAGIKVGMYGSPIGKTDIADAVDIELGRIDHLGKMLEVFGATNVRIFSFYNKEGLPQDQWKQQSFDKLTKLSERAAELGLVLYHENETEVYGDHPDQIVELAELRNDSFKLIYDFANYQRTGAEPWANWQRLKPTTDALHFKDQKANGDHVPIGKGNTMANEIMADAVKTGWSGPCTLEPHLYMSDAVLATNVHGRGDTSLEGKTREELFQIAAENAHQLMSSAGAM